MKAAVQKSAIPLNKAFVVRDLVAPHFDPNWHFHPEYQLFVVMEGTGTRFVGDSIKPFREGDMILSGPNMPHLWRSDDAYFNKGSQLRTRGVVVYFQENFLGEGMLQKEEMEHVHQLLLRARRGLEVTGNTNRHTLRLLQELPGLSGVESIVQFLRILDLLAHSPECLYITPADYVNQYKVTETDRMNQVHHYVLQNFRHKISLDEVASLASMTPTSFSRYFKARASKPFSNFVSEIRIGYACKLLHEGEQTISQICYECGFNTLSNFNRQFKEIMGKTPLEYKEEYLRVLP